MQKLTDIRVTKKKGSVNLFNLQIIFWGVRGGKMSKWNSFPHEANLKAKQAEPEPGTPSTLPTSFTVTHSLLPAIVWSCITELMSPQWVRPLYLVKPRCASLHLSPEHEPQLEGGRETEREVDCLFQSSELRKLLATTYETNEGEEERYK